MISCLTKPQSKPLVVPTHSAQAEPVVSLFQPTIQCVRLRSSKITAALLGKSDLCRMGRYSPSPGAGLVSVLLVCVCCGACSQGLPRDAASVLSAGSAAQTLAGALQRAEQMKREVRKGTYGSNGGIRRSYAASAALFAEAVLLTY